MLVGRTAERDRIDALLAGARSGRSGILVLRGEAGIGKSALLGYAREQAGGMTLLKAQGVETEAELAFAGLTELLRPAIGEIGRLPDAAGRRPPQRRSRTTPSRRTRWPSGSRC